MSLNDRVHIEPNVPNYANHSGLRTSNSEPDVPRESSIDRELRRHIDAVSQSHGDRINAQQSVTMENLINHRSVNEAIEKILGDVGAAGFRGAAVDGAAVDGAATGIQGAELAAGIQEVVIVAEIESRLVGANSEIFKIEALVLEMGSAAAQTVVDLDDVDPTNAKITSVINQANLRMSAAFAMLEIISHHQNIQDIIPLPAGNNGREADLSVDEFVTISYFVSNFFGAIQKLVKYEILTYEKIVSILRRRGTITTIVEAVAKLANVILCHIRAVEKAPSGDMLGVGSSFFLATWYTEDSTGVWPKLIKVFNENVEVVL
ncbi:MAG: hypothetical protein LBR91_01825 [Puniceicoccales bacterium]|nr:hypothetical protein [Puniceicoccales bacterium]